MSRYFDKLVRIMSKLRGPNGCPWDHKQTHKSIIPQLIEEAYEVVSAIEDKNMPHLCEELGDLLLHIVFHAQMAKEDGNFTADDVAKGICEKLIRRHPHVFGTGKAKSAEEVIKNWDKIKSEEKKNNEGASLLDSIPRSLPALFQAHKLSKKASKAGFDWEKTRDVISKIEEEIGELKKAVRRRKPKEIEHEIGDVFFSLANLSRFLDVQAEEALRKTNNRFRLRFGLMEKYIKQTKKNRNDLSPAQWNNLWVKAKKKLG